ncbi:unnamed protein product [Rhizophagus irregularis]|nr:unnamed protein product [Rhizophagus irregularis]
MNQLNEKEIKYKKCIRCKQVDSETKFCETCISKNCENKYGRCFECKQVNTQKEWCQICNSKRFQQNFGNWTSGNDDIDKLIQNTQLTARSWYQVLEWIPYDRFYNIKYVAKGGFGKVYSAIWKDGFILLWDKYKNQLQRHTKVQVALKSLNESQNIKLEFISEITSYLKIHENEYIRNVIKCHGISQDPITKDYIIVTNYAMNGNLQSALKSNKYKIHNTNNRALLRMWINKLYILLDISSGLNGIHDKELIHRDLHVGNIVCFARGIGITDMGFCKPANYDELEDKKYGVLPYMAPEILRGGNYTKASDIYSLGLKT